ncbi:hypothetical protein D3C79_846220 [compost metagenome]
MGELEPCVGFLELGRQAFSFFASTIDFAECPVLHLLGVAFLLETQLFRQDLRVL